MLPPETIMQRLILTTMSLAALSALLPASADAREEWFEPASLGMGGATRTLGGDMSAVRMNPAAMAGKATYLTGASYSFYGRERSHIFSTGGYDSQSSNLALGTAYSVHISTPPFDPNDGLNWYSPDDVLLDTSTTHRWEVSAAYALLDRRINFGLGVRILRHNYALRANTMRFTMDTGITLWPAKVIGIGVSLQNFIPTTDDNFPTRLNSGLAVSIPQIVDIAADAVIDLTTGAKPKVDVHGGINFKALQLVLIRAGYYGDGGFKDNYVTWGLGLEIPTPRIKIKIDYAMRIEVGPMDGALRDDRDEGWQRIWNSVGFNLGF